MNITAADLIAALEGIDPSTPIQIAYQPTYPLAAQITGITAGDNGNLTIEGFGESDYYQPSSPAGNLLDY